MADAPRVRFAPSPTGFFHVGGAKTALYNWIYARQHGGVFVLRIEDTDTERNRGEWIEGIQTALQWIGVTWDEGPYYQSTRASAHLAAAQGLYAAGAAYYCDCTREVIDERTKGLARPGYDGFCRDRGLGPGEGRPLRFRTPREGATVVHDLIRGEPTFENVVLEDFVLVRSNGTAMFLLANVVDDMDMGITHVIRAEEHLPNTPKAILLWTALDPDRPLPVWAHVPLLVNEKRQKLSKRRDPVALEGYRDEGYLPEAMQNFLMLLGWAPRGDREILPFDAIVAEFRLEDVNPSPAYFDVKKLAAINGEYIRALSTEEFIKRAQPWLARFGPDLDQDAFAAMAPLVQTRVTRLGEVPDYVDFLFLPSAPEDHASWDKAMKPPAAELLDEVLARFADADWQADALKAALEGAGEAHGLKLAKAQAPVRVAVTGRTVGPPLFESLVVLGRDRTLERLRGARARL